MSWNFSLKAPPGQNSGAVAASLNSVVTSLEENLTVETLHLVCAFSFVLRGYIFYITHFI